MLLSSFDNIIDEYFIEGIEDFDKPLKIMFNFILGKQHFQTSRSKGVVIPVYNKGDNTNPNNYRSITLKSCFTKLFTSVINERPKMED